MATNKSASEHEPSAYGERPSGIEKLTVYAIMAIAIGLIAALLWWAAQAA